MEARASLSGASISRTFVAAILVIVALGLTAMGGYLAHSMSGSSAAATQGQTYAAPGTVLRQDDPSQPAASPAQERSTGHRELP